MTGRDRARGGRTAVLLACVAVITGCGNERPGRPLEPPLPSPTPAIVPTASQGPTRITFAAASHEPGSTVAGCGPEVQGCAGRLRMTFELRSASGGPVLWVSGFLHATNLIACLSGRTESLELRPGEPALVELVFDRADRCATPVTIATMAVVVEGPVETASRQEWALRYTFAP